MQKEVEYKEASRTKYPSQVVIVIAKDKDGKANPVTIGWFMTASASPPMMAFALVPKRYTTEAIRHSKCFTIVYPNEGQADAAMFFGTHSGGDTDKLAEFDCKTEPAKEIDSVLMTDAVANFECTLESETVAGDHIIFVGRVLTSHINTQEMKTLYAVGSGHKLGRVIV